jgi:hypothetical protein
MKNKHLITCLAAYLVLNIGCKKDLNQPLNNDENYHVSGIKLEEGRLKLNSINTFNSLINEAYKNKENSNFLIDKFDKLFSHKFNSLELFKKQSTNGLITNSNSNNSNEPSLDKLVPDQIFASILNENGELQVDSTIYKVTKYGTFMIASSKLNKLNLLINSWNSKSTNTLLQNSNTLNKVVNSYSNPSNFSPFDNMNEVSEHLYLFDSDIYLYDSFNYSDGNIPSFIDDEDLNSGYNSPDFLPNFYNGPVDYATFWSTTTMNGPGSGVFISQNESYIYDNLETYSFGAKTFVGKLIDDLRGRNEIHTIAYSDKNRVRVNFYDASYIIYSALGVSVKMQKKNWIGWSTTNADELRIGWDYIEYDSDYGLSFTPPQIGYVDPFNKPFHFPIDVPGSDKKYELFDLTVFGYRVNPTVKYDSKTKQKIIKEMYDFAQNQLSPSEKNTLTNKPFAFLTYQEVFNDKRMIKVGKDEERSYSNDKMSKTFDWKTGTLKLNINSEGTASVSGSVAKDFSLTSASVYGIAKYDNKWKGVRIVM